MYFRKVILSIIGVIATSCNLNQFAFASDNFSLINDTNKPIFLAQNSENIPNETKIKVTEIKVLGSSIFSEQQLQKIVAPFLNQELTFEDLLTLRTVVTKLYTDQGYTTSGAFLPIQDVTDGIVEIQIVEGAIETIEIQGLSHLTPNYIRSRLNLATTSPVNIKRLEEALQLLQFDPIIKKIDAELTAGTTQGKNILMVNVTENPALNVSLELNNYDSPSVGSFGPTGIIESKNLLGLGDSFYADYRLTEGVDSANIQYQIPVNAKDGKVTFSYENDKITIVEDPFSRLNINSESETFSVGFKQPLIRNTKTELALGLSLDIRDSQTYLEGNKPLSFSGDPVNNGKSKVTALRFSQEWVNRGKKTVLAARSQFSFGLDLFDPTINNNNYPDGQFTNWLGQFQWVQILGKDTLLITRLGTQLSFDSLLPMEQFNIGGVDTVRGYRTNQRVGDNAFVGSLELRFPIVKNSEAIGTIELTPFFDIGTVWNNEGNLPDPTTLSSIGLGLRWQIKDNFFARLDWGIPLTEIDNQGDSIQDNGVTFSVRFQP
jgi:hemolysin activation/secretion protein